LNCQDAQKVLHGYVDGELDLVKNLEIEEHLQECSACAQAHQSLQALRGAIRGEVRYYESPTQLRARISSAIRNAKGDEPRARSYHMGWLALAASIVFVAIGAWGLTRIISSAHHPPTLVEELVASHVRSQMLPAHLVDVESSDGHTVKPWFEGKLDYSPEVRDLAGQGFTLVGGRLDYIDRRSVAVLIYQRRKHLINLFSWPASQDSVVAPIAWTRQGYHLLSWSHSGMTYWVVSDLNENELREFVELMQS
jgi:anti-sigma factor RsiW